MLILIMCSFAASEPDILPSLIHRHRVYALDFYIVLIIALPGPLLTITSALFKSPGWDAAIKLKNWVFLM